MKLKLADETAKLKFLEAQLIEEERKGKYSENTMLEL